MGGSRPSQESGRPCEAHDYHGGMHSAPEPFLDSRDFERVACAIRYIEAHFQQQPRLATIAAQVQLSEFHFNRLVRRWAGITPKQYLTFVTGKAAGQALEATRSVLDAAYSVGLSGPGRLHDLVVTLHAMTPGEFKGRGSGTLIRHGVSLTPFGRALIASTERGICHLSFVASGAEGAELAELRARWPRARFEPDDAQAVQFARQIWSPTDGARIELALNIGGTNFQLQVWQALLDLGSGRLTTYAELAQRAGVAGAARAVGGAVGANPVAWLIPCHRVLRKDGVLGGYRWGEDRKRAMLAWQSLASTPEYVMRAARPDGVSITALNQ